MSKNLFIRQLDAMESKSFIDAAQIKTVLKISLALIFFFGLTFTFKDDILSLLRQHPTEMSHSHKNMQGVKIATAE